MLQVASAPGTKSEKLMEALAKPLDQRSLKIRSIQMDMALRDEESVSIVRLVSGNSESEKSCSHSEASEDAATVAQEAAKLVNDIPHAGDGLRISASAENPKYARDILSCCVHLQCAMRMLCHLCKC